MFARLGILEHHVKIVLLAMNVQDKVHTSELVYYDVVVNVMVILQVVIMNMDIVTIVSIIQKVINVSVVNQVMKVMLAVVLLKIASLWLRAHLVNVTIIHPGDVILSVDAWLVF